MKPHIVVIEDDRDFLLLVTFLLEEEGYKVTGLTALCTIEDLIALNADCFILDEHLPFVSGHIICLMLKTNPGTKFIPVILASAVKNLREIAERYNADAFIPKPLLDISDLSRLVAATINPNNGTGHILRAE
jgi:CheY-like chemotaxis protein